MIFSKQLNQNILVSLLLIQNRLDNTKLIKINEIIRSHPVEVIGKKLRTSMTSMKTIV